jgi:hypothetical protein
MSNTKNDEVIQELTAEDIAQISGGMTLADLNREIEQIIANGNSGNAAPDSVTGQN